MKKLLFVFLISLPITPQIENDNGYGTGFIYKNGIVVTAAHLMGPNLKVENTDVEVLGLDLQNDIMVLKQTKSTLKRGKMKFREPELDEPVKVIHYGLGISMITRGRVIAIRPDNKQILIDAVCPGGASGAAVYNQYDEVIGMVVAGMGDSHGTVVTIAVSSSVIEPFVKSVTGGVK